jgi:hypothetical protein
MYFEYNGFTVITKANWLDAGLTEGQYKKDRWKGLLKIVLAKRNNLSYIDFNSLLPNRKAVIQAKFGDPDQFIRKDEEALARKRAEGVILGRPKGSKSKVKKLTGKEAEIKTLLDKKVSKSAIARILGVHRLTVAEFVKEKL